LKLNEMCVNTQQNQAANKSTNNEKKTKEAFFFSENSILQSHISFLLADD